MDNPIAICGLRCDKCDLFLVDEDKKIAQGVLGWFKNEGWRPESMTVEEFMQEGKFCMGCRSDRKATGQIPQSVQDFIEEQLNVRKIYQETYNLLSQRHLHWSANCDLVACCVDEKKLDSCHECDEFVCEKLEKWKKSGEKYAEGVELLRSLKK